MKILIGTPCFGGQLFDGYLISMIKTINGFHKDHTGFAVLTIANESMINRGRNKIANYLLQHKEFDKLLFIDADISWEYAHIVRLLQSDKFIVGGTYPLKTFPIAPNFNPLPAALQEFSIPKTVEQWEKFKKKYADPKTGEAQISHLPTGFMMIDRSVFERLVGKVQKYLPRDMSADHSSEFHEFFPVRVKNGILESEDWSFCSICQENGITVWLNTEIFVKHTGMYTWSV